MTRRRPPTSGVPDMTADTTPDAGALRRRMLTYLHEHHTATIATVGPLPEPASVGATPAAGGEDRAADVATGPHAATVFYAADDHFRLVFLSKGSSTHGSHIGAGSRVAVTVSGQFDDWREIRGLQLWGSAAALHGAARAAALAGYLRRFPFVRELLTDARMVRQFREIAVFRVTAERASLTDNTVGLFGREVLEDLQGKAGGRVAGTVGAASGDEMIAAMFAAADVAGGAIIDEGVRGVVATGKREAVGFLDIPWVKLQVQDFLGADPFPGTLNLQVRDARSLAAWRERAGSGACLTLIPMAEGFCAASYFPVVLNGEVEGGVIVPHVEGYPDDVLEVVSTEGLRHRFGLVDGDEVTVEWAT
jgi:uncharacterized protein YhbP (UPF0306 family)